MDTIRSMPAKKKHAKEIAQLIYNTEDYPEEVFGAGNKEEIVKRLIKLVKRSDTRYSYKYATVAVFEDEVAGVLIALPHSLMPNLNKNTSKALLKSITLKEKIKFIWSMITSLGFKESDKGEYYIANLSTFEKFRGKGVGTLLMKEAEKSAKNQNLEKCSLLVSTEREDVLRLYSKLDYKIKEKSRCSEGSYFRMIKYIGLT